MKYIPVAKQIDMPSFVYWMFYRFRVRKFEWHPLNKGDIVFLGDSITNWANWDKLFPGVPVRNFGIAGDTSAGVLARLHQITTGHPAKVFLLIGTNDLHYGRASEEQIIVNIASIIDCLRAESPATEIYVESIMPRHIRWAKQVMHLNDQLKPVVVEHGATWIDLWPLLEDGKGQLRSDFTIDRLHLRKAGIQAWANYLRKIVEA